MKNLQVFFLSLTLIGTSGCFKAELPSEDAFRSASTTWGAGSATEVNFSALQMGTTQSIQFSLNDGFSCSCSVSSNGDPATGNLTVLGCTYTGATANDPGCADLANTYHFTTASGSLQICDASGGCQSFN